VTQPVADVVMAACRKIAWRGGGYVTLPQVQADEDVGRVVRSAERVIDVMGTLAGERKVRMTARHPVPTWLVTEEEA
jgi:hypothetical protein